MPGSESIKLPVYKRERHIVGRVAIGVFVVAAIIFVIGAVQTPAPELPKNESYVPAGMAPVEASVVERLEGWRIATSSDLPQSSSVNRSGAPGKVTGDFSGRGTNDDVAYLLTDDRHQFRLVIIGNHAVRYDGVYPIAAAIARVPRDSVSNINWNGAAPSENTTDGILLVERGDDPTSGIVLFYAGDSLVTGTPTDYRNVPVE